MGKKFIMGTAMVMTATVFSACHNTEPNVYGPPPTEPESVTTEYNETVYGPPEVFDPTISTVPEEITTEYDPSQEINEDVYGPPEWFE